MKAVSLSKAWLEFWPILFPENPDREAMLAGWVRSNLFQFDPGSFNQALAPSSCTPEWASSLTIYVDRDGAAVSAGGLALPLSPWFAAKLVSHDPRWVGQHPFELWVENGARQDATARYWADQSAAMLRNITLRAGQLIKSALAAAVRDRRLDTTGLSATDGYSDRRPVTAGQVAAMAELNLGDNKIAFSRGVPAIIDVKVSRNPDYKLGKRAGGSFKEEDDILIEEMHQLLKRGLASSVYDAALKVLPRARRRGSADDESVMQRLIRRHGTKYRSRRRL
jgi:hypothetical protein